MTSRQAAELDYALERNGLTSSDVKKMSKGGFLTGVRRVLRGEAIIKIGGLLEQFAITDVSGAEKFVVKNAFGPDNPAGIKFWLGYNFKKHFLGLVEENVPATELMINTLVKLSLDAPIIAELGNRVEIMLAHLYELISRQSNGAYLSYICGTDGNRWAVNADWYSTDREWSLDANSVENPPPWREGSQVVSQVS